MPVAEPKKSRRAFLAVDHHVPLVAGKGPEGHLFAVGTEDDLALKDPGVGLARLAVDYHHAAFVVLLGDVGHVAVVGAEHRRADAAIAGLLPAVDHHGPPPAGRGGVGQPLAVGAECERGDLLELLLFLAVQHGRHAAFDRLEVCDPPPIGADCRRCLHLLGKRGQLSFGVLAIDLRFAAATARLPERRGALGVGEEFAWEREMQKAKCERQKGN